MVLMKNYCVYLLSFLNGKFYVGLTQDFRRRLSEHIKKYKNINKFQILHNNLSLVQARIWEIIEIANYKSYMYQKNSMGYNKTLGGELTHTKIEFREIKINELKKKIEESRLRNKLRKLNKKYGYRRIKFSELHEAMIEELFIKGEKFLE